MCLTVLYMQILDHGCVKSLLANTKTLRQILEEALSLMKMFWRAALPSTDPSIQNLKKVCYVLYFMTALNFQSTRLRIYNTIAVRRPGTI